MRSGRLRFVETRRRKASKYLGRSVFSSYIMNGGHVHLNLLLVQMESCRRKSLPYVVSNSADRLSSWMVHAGLLDLKYGHPSVPFDFA